MANSETGASTSDSSGSEYQVFLSFRGPDTRRGFTDVLYRDVKDAGIHVFIDNEELRPGEVISGNLLRGINDSKLYIPIFSPNYASSHWCLRELAKMVENTSNSEDGNKMKKVILPIFYDVKPKDVKLKTELYKNAISKLDQRMEDQKKKFSTEEVETWRRALRRVARAEGWESGKYTGDGDLSKTVVNEVLDRLETRQREVTEDFVGMEDRIAAINNLLDVDSDGVRLLVIYGMGGVGKTTLATEIFNQLCPRFGKNCSFLGDVRETAKTKGIVELQKRLLSDISNSRADRNIVDSDNGMKAIEETIRNKEVLIVLDDVGDGNQIQRLIGRNPLCHGTRILVTTRDIGVLNIRGFKHRFKPYVLEGLSDEHALQLFSRHAFNEYSPPPNFYGLSKDIVSTTGGLPLALGAIGSSLFGVKNKKRWEKRLEELREIPHSDVLGMLRISYDALEWDHQQIFLDVACFFIGENKTFPIEMWEDREFDPEKAIDCLKKRCMIKVLNNDGLWMHDQFRDLGRIIAKEEHTRLWDRDGIIHETEIKQKVQALRLQAKSWNSVTVTAKDIEQFPNLQFLWLSGVICQGDFTGCLSKLKWIYLSCQRDGPGYRTTNLHLENVENAAVMHTDCYGLAEWYKSPVPIVEAKKLKVLKLSCASWLHRIPTFSGWSVLEKLTVSSCSILAEIDSVGELKHLTELIVEHCGELLKLPEQIGELNKLQHLSLKGCRNLMELPDSISKLKSLTKLDLSNTRITSLPDSMDKLSQLDTLDLHKCHTIQELPELPISLTTLRLETHSLEIVPDLSYLTNLVELTLSHCFGNPVQPCHFPWIGGLRKMEKLTLDGLNFQTLKLDGLPQLEKLTIIRCVLTGLSITSSLRKPREATVVGGDKLVEVQFIGVLQSLEILDIGGCESLERLVCVSEEESGCHDELTDGLRRASILSGYLNMLQNLILEGCPKLQEIRFVSMMESLEILVVKGCDSLRRLGGLPNLKNLKTLQIEEANSLQIVEGIDELERVERLTIDGCRSMGRIFDVSNPKIPKECRISLSCCGKLLETSPHGSVMTWERYKEELLNAPTQAPASDIETTFSDSEVETGDPLSEQEATKLKVFNLHNSDCSHWTPAFSENSVLETLSISNCKRLVEIDCSIGKLRCLTELKVEWCKKLSKLPEEIGELKNLQRLSLKGCKNLRELPDSISKLESLTMLDVAFTRITSLPDSLDKLHSLSSLDLSYTEIVKLPGTMSKLSQLHTLDLSCTKIVKLPGTMSKLSQLHTLNLSKCHEIQELPELPRSLTSLWFQSESLQTIHDLSNLTNLEKLSLSDESHGRVRSNLIQPCHFVWTGGLSKLRKMNLCLFNVHAKSADWAYFPLLEELTLSGLDLQTGQQLPSNLRVLELFWIQGKQAELDGLPQLEKLIIRSCELTGLSIRSSLRKLREVTVDSCDELVEVQFIGVLQSMKILDIRECRSLERLVCGSEEESGCHELQPCELTDGLRRASIVSGSLKMLQQLSLEICPKLQEIRFASMMESLENLFVKGCGSLRSLGGLSNLKNLKKLLIQYAHSLQIVEGIDELECVERLMIHGCKSIGMIIDVSTSKIPDKCQMYLSFCGELHRTFGSISWERYRVNVMNAQTQASDFDIRTDPYGATRMWERYKKDNLNAPTQASASEIETTFSNSEVETGDLLSEQQDDGDEDDDGEDGGGDDNEEDNEHEDHENNDEERMRTRTRKRKRGTMKKPKRSVPLLSKMKVRSATTMNTTTTRNAMAMKKAMSMRFCSRLGGLYRFIPWTTTMRRRKSKGEGELMATTRKRKRTIMKKPKKGKMTVMTTRTMSMTMTRRKTMALKNTMGATTTARTRMATRTTMRMRFCSRLGGLYRFIPWTTTTRRRKAKGKSKSMAATRKRKRPVMKKLKRR